LTPESNTLYSLSLFFALVALMLWSKRRHRAARQFRRGVAESCKTEPVCKAEPVKVPAAP